MRFFRRRPREAPPQWVVVRAVVPYPEAVIARGLLDTAGITTKFERLDNPNVVHQLGQPGPVRLLVTSDRYDEAAALLPE